MRNDCVGDKDMSVAHYEFDCAYCNRHLTIEQIETYMVSEIRTICDRCYLPLSFYPQDNKTKIRQKSIRKTAFLIHSAKGEDKVLINWLRTMTQVYGVTTHVIEEDRRTEPDWLQKSIDGIRSSDFILVFLTKRYQYYRDDKSLGWKAPDKCYDEIAMAFALGTMLGGKEMFALVEEDVSPGNVLEARAWCYRFKREDNSLKTDTEFFVKLDDFTGI